MSHHPQQTPHIQLQHHLHALRQAQVKLLKCLVDNIVVDISFNQLGGLCTLAFLEEIDRLVRPEHLFKRSIILVSVWTVPDSIRQIALRASDPSTCSRGASYWWALGGVYSA